MKPYNLFLIGYRCTGKSSVGKLIAARLGWPFLDTDSLLVSQSGLSIKDIVAAHGWEKFRSMEQVIMQQVCIHGQRVVATGGGVVLNAENVKLMKNSGRLVWLQANSATIKKRMMQDSGTEAFRPALTSRDSIAEIEESLLERDPLYKQAMDFCVETDDRQIDEICDAIIRQMNK